MGSMKHLMDREQELHDLGRGLCLETGALKQCGRHEGEYYDGGVDVAEAYKLANDRVSSGEIELKDGETRTTITDAVQQAYEDNASATRCSFCEAIRRKE